MKTYKTFQNYHPKKDVLFIIGDQNAKVGSQETPGITAKFGLGVWNEAGQRLTEFFFCLFVFFFIALKNFKYVNILWVLKMHIICQIASSLDITIIFDLWTIQNDFDSQYRGNLSQSFMNETDVNIQKMRECH